MKKFKKKMYIAAFGVLTTVCASSLWMGVSSLSTASAAVTEQLVYSDDFNAETLSDNWTATDAAISSEYCSLRVQPSEYAWPGHILCQGYKMDGDCRLEIKMQELPADNASWVALSFGAPSTISIFEKSSGAFIFMDDQTSLFKEGKSVGYDFNYSPKGNVVGNDVATVVLDFVKRSSGTYDITYIVKNGDEVLGNTLIENFTVQDGYFGFNTYGTHFDILSFDVYEGEEKVYTDDFSSSQMSYDDNVIKNSAWVALAPFTSKTASIAPVGKLDLSTMGASAVYKDAFVQKSTGVAVLYELSAQFDFSRADLGVASGFEIAKPTLSEEGVFVGLVRNSAGYQIVFSAGERKEELLVAGNPTDGIWNVRLAVNYDNSITLFANDFRITFELDSKAEGYFGIKTSDDYASSGVGAFVDDFSFRRYTYSDSDAKDMKMNFEGTREYEDEDGKYYQYYYSTKDWYAGSNVRLSNHGFADNGYVLFGNASVDSTFGPKVKYSDCIVRFDITLVGSDYYYDNPDSYYDTPTGTGACEAECFGLQFGSKSYKNNYVNTQSLGIATYSQKDGDKYVGAKSVYYTTNCNLASNSDGVVYCANADRVSGNEYDLFRKSATYNFMYVIKNGTVSMHFKEASEDESVLGIVREYVTGVETNGYLAVYGANGVDFRLDNLSIISLDRNYTSSAYACGEDLQTLRVDVAKGDELAAFDADSNALTTKAVTGSNITRVTLGEVNHLTYKQGGLEIVFSGRGALVSYGQKTEEITFNMPLLFRGATIEICRIDDTVSVGFANAGAPLTVIDDNTYSVSGFEVAGREKISLSAQGGIKITKITIFNLDSKVSMETRNFDAETDIIQPWIERKSAQDKGCNSVVGASSAILLIPAVWILKRKKNDNE